MLVLYIESGGLCEFKNTYTISCDIFVELGDVEKYLLSGHVPNASVVIARLTVKVRLIVTNLLHEVDLVLGVNLLHIINLVVECWNAKLYMPNVVHTRDEHTLYIASHESGATRH